MRSTDIAQTPDTNQASLAALQSCELRELITQAAAVSFDFFDTLFVRPLAHPEDAFDILGRQFDISNFRAIRKAAQTEAFRRMQSAGRKEISLKDIYACFPDVGVDRSLLMEAEFKLELALVEPNSEVVALFSDLIASGKRVVITSDMYLSADFFEQALQQHKLEIVPLFISADINATKRDSGELFEAVADSLNLAASDILHIGDNQLADVVRANEKGFLTFLYEPNRRQLPSKTVSLETAIGHGLLSTSAQLIAPRTYAELGFLYGGPANLGFLEWIRERARNDRIDHVLFLSRDGYSLSRLADRTRYSDFPPHSYFWGSRVAYTLAAIDSENFDQFIPFFLSGADGLSPYELLERIGVDIPAPHVMNDLELGADVKVTPALYPLLATFLHAYRWQILKVCQRNRRALHQYIRQLGIKPGSRVALIDVGWNGTTQEALERALLPLMDLDVYGYYFCLANTPERVKRDATQKMVAMVDSTSTGPETVASVYANRVAVEQFFSAPHSSIIGLQAGAQGIEPVMDMGRGDTTNLMTVTEEVCRGIESFAEHYGALLKRIELKSSPVQMAMPLIEMLGETSGNNAQELLGRIKNFDTWGSSRNLELVLATYLSQ